VRRPKRLDWALAAIALAWGLAELPSGGARRILERDRLRARDAAELIAGTGREALVELQRLLGVLNLEPAAAPTLDGLDGLVERARAAGLPVALTVDGERRPAARWHRARGLPGGPGGHHQRDQVRGRGADRGSRLLWRGGRRAARLRPRSGGRRAGARGRRRHGLVGMRERVRIFGGELHTGRRAGGGLEVRARLPIDGRAEHA
jgi:hypothetical protein